MVDRPHDAFRLHGEEGDKQRPTLDRIFKAGEEARRIGVPRRDNPYAAGSEERREWEAGWSATADCDEDPSDEPSA